MLEEKNENLQEANENVDTNTIDTNLQEAAAITENYNAIEVSSDKLDIDNTTFNDPNESVVNAITNVNAEESEDETLKERHEIPMIDYDTLSMENLVDELEKLVDFEKVMAVKDHVELIKSAFLSKYNHLIEEKKHEFQSENPDTLEDFEYHFPLKNKFDQFYTVFKDKRSVHFKSLEANLKGNLEERLEIIEAIKTIINPQENIKDTLKSFNELRERWKNAGPIPKDKYNHVWNNYHFHVENFYDYLHLDREARDLDFKHNLEQKLKIITRVEALVLETDVNKAFRELQDLHKIWKEDIGPVALEHRDNLWNRFSELTKIMHDKREEIYEKQRAVEADNLALKNEIISQIEILATEKVSAHSQWLTQIEKVEALRNAFFAVGKVPSEVNEDTWAAFKVAVRNFNNFKNSFYRDIKKEQQENLNKKTALLEKAKILQESDDFETTTPLMKQIQEDWKTIGHVPKKYSDDIWKEFKSTCNAYFDKVKAAKNETNQIEIEAFEKKKSYLESLREFQLTGDHKTDLDAIKNHIETWKSLGRVSANRRHIEGKFNKILDALFEKLSLSKKDSEMARFTNRIDHLTSLDDSRKLENEKIFLIRKIEEVQHEIFQLENNIQFFANAKKDNPMVLEVRKSIERHKETLELWKDKLKHLNTLKES